MKAEVVIEKVVEARKLLDMIEPGNRSTYSWSEASRADDRLISAKMHLNSAIEALGRAVAHERNLFVINEMILLMTDGTCRDIIESARLEMQRMNIDISKATSIAFGRWWEATFIVPLDVEVEQAGRRKLNAYVLIKEQEEKDELEDLLRLHS